MVSLSPPPVRVTDDLRFEIDPGAAPLTAPQAFELAQGLIRAATLRTMLDAADTVPLAPRPAARRRRDA